MKKIIKIIGIIGFIICLVLMYMPGGGIAGIQGDNPVFRLLDMQFRYGSTQVESTLTSIGAEGRSAYRNYLLLDFTFIACFLITMVTITGAAVKQPRVQRITMALCVFRALFDVLENTLLLIAIRRFPAFSPSLATLCSWSTTLKFIMLYTWVIVVVAFPLISHNKRISRK